MPRSHHQEYLSKLPTDWEKVTLGQLGTIYSGGTPSRLVSSFWNGDIAWVTPGELTDLDGKWIEQTNEHITKTGLAGSSAKLLPEKTLLFTSRATIGSVAIAAIPVATNQGFKSIVPNQLTNPVFYCYLLQYIASEAIRLASGSTFDEISRRDFIDIVVPRPFLKEQRQIAQIIGTIDEAIAHTESLINKLKLIKAGLLHDLLTCGLGEDGELRDPIKNPHRFKDSPLGLIPTDWEIATLKEFISRQPNAFIQTGPFGSQLHSYEYTESGVPVIMPQDMRDRYISEHQIAYISSSKATFLARHIVEINDVVFARRGDLDRCAAISEREVGWLCGTGCMLIRPPKQEVDGRWLAAVYRHYQIQQQVLGRAVGTTMVNLNSTILSQLLVAKPSLSEQEMIVHAFEMQEKCIQEEEAYRDKLKLQKRGLMDDLLTGRVRVNFYRK